MSLYLTFQESGVYFMSTACGRLQGGGGPAHVNACGQGREVENRIFCGRHKWMAS